MINLTKLGWDAKTLGEIDHQKVKPPYVRLSTYTTGEKGDIVYFYDLRIAQPNAKSLTTKVLHSFEHLLLAGFRKQLGEHFICVAPMGCQTGFYLVLLNEGEAEKICALYATILLDILQTDNVPYASVVNCGQAVHHDLSSSKALARELLSHKADWRQVL